MNTQNWLQTWIVSAVLFWATCQGDFESFKQCGAHFAFLWGLLFNKKHKNEWEKHSKQIAKSTKTIQTKS